MKFSELYNFAVSRRVLTEGTFTDTNVSTAFDAPARKTKSIADFVGEVYGVSTAVGNLAVGVAGDLGATAGSAQSYTAKQLLEELRPSLPIINTLAHFFSALGSKNKGEPFITKTDPVTVEEQGPPKVTITLNDQTAKWKHLCTLIPLDRITKLLNLLEDNKNDIEKYLEAAKKEDLIFPSLARRLSERSVPSMSLETLVTINPIFRSVAFAVAQHFNDTQNNVPENTYRRVLNALFNAPQQLTFMFSHGFGNGDVLGMYRSSQTDTTGIDVKTSKFELNLAADDPETRVVLSHINTIAANLLQFTANLYSKFKKTEDVSMKNDQSNYSNEPRKVEIESGEDATLMQQMYGSILTGVYSGDTTLNTIKNNLTDIADTFIDMDADYSLWSDLASVTIKTVKDLEVIENKFALPKVVPEIKKALQELSVPMTPASILGMTKDFANAMSRLDRARV